MTNFVKIVIKKNLVKRNVMHSGKRNITNKLKNLFYIILKKAFYLFKI